MSCAKTESKNPLTYSLSILPLHTIGVLLQINGWFDKVVVIVIMNLWASDFNGDAHEAALLLAHATHF